MVVSPFFFHNDDLIKILIHVTEKMRCSDTRRANKMTVNLFNGIPFFDQLNILMQLHLGLNLDLKYAIIILKISNIKIM